MYVYKEKCLERFIWMKKLLFFEGIFLERFSKRVGPKNTN